jgi:hypothetical protein
MKIIDTILSSVFFSKQPPVLIDIGASGEINTKWKAIAPYAICIAFDADDRDFKVDEKVNTSYKKLIVFNRIVTAEAISNTSFYLTTSPYCSSLLKPEIEKLNPWVFKDLFKVEKVATLPAITLADTLQQAGITYIDWFKSDTQGTDLRLFKSLSSDLSDQVLAAEFEPGIIDAYEGEDKLFVVMQEMHNRNFWLSSMDVKGTQRVNPDYTKTMGSFVSERLIRKSPCWAEVTYLRQTFPATQRQLLLLYVFALLEKQFGFALEVIDYAMGRYNDPIFQDCKAAVLNQLSSEKLKTPFVVFKRQLNKLFSNIHD